MQLEQVIVRPGEQVAILQGNDVVGRSFDLIVSQADVPSYAQFVSECQQKLPSPSENPAKTQIQQEISELEYRLKQLRESIGIEA